MPIKIKVKLCVKKNSYLSLVFNMPEKLRIKQKVIYFSIFIIANICFYFEYSQILHPYLYMINNVLFIFTQ